MAGSLTDERLQAAPEPPRARVAAWAAASAVALLAMSVWLSASRVEYLVGASLATSLCAFAALGLRGRRGTWALLVAGALAALVLSGWLSQRALRDVEARWQRTQARLAAGARRDLARELESAVRELDTMADRALALAAERPPAAALFAELAKLPEADWESGVLLLERGRPLAWGGRSRLLPDSAALQARTAGLATSPFYLTLWSSRERDGRRAVATALIYSAPPADRLTRSLSATVADRVEVQSFTFAPAEDAVPSGAQRFAAGGEALFDAVPVLPAAGEARLRRLERARLRTAVLLALAVAVFILGAWRMSRSLGWRLAILGVALTGVALAPLSAFSNKSRLFDSSLYFTPLAGPLTANAGALAITSGLVLLALLTLVRRHGARIPPWWSIPAVLAVAGLGPFLLRNLARGIRMPPYGVSSSLWLIWEVPLFLAAVSVLLAGGLAGSAALGRKRGLPPLLAPAFAGVAAFLGPVVWQAPHQWPWWYTLLWVAAIGALALSRLSRQVVVHASIVAALGATTLVWANTARGRVDLARRDLAGLSAPDPALRVLLERIAPALLEEPPTTRTALLQQYVTSDLAAAALPVELIAAPDGGAPEVLRTGDVQLADSARAAIIAEARSAGRPILRDVPASPATLLVLAVPAPGATTVVTVAPRTRLLSHDPFARLLGVELPDEADEPPYALQLSSVATGAPLDRPPLWRRVRNELHGDLMVQAGSGLADAHVEVELRPLDALVERGVLITLFNLALVGLLWFMAVVADGGAGRWARVRQRSWWRSYRARLTFALFAFFVIPAAAFAVWSYRQLLDDAAGSRELLVRETLRAVEQRGIDGAAGEAGPGSWLARESDRLESPILLYTGGQLDAASDSLLAELAPSGRLLPAPVALELAVAEEKTASALERVGDAIALFGYRAVDGRGVSMVLSAPARSGEVALDRRRRDLGVLVLFATAVGGLAALWLSGIAARELARPIGSLRVAALAIARGEREPALPGEPTAEFAPVFAAFRRMASDLGESRAALEAAQRRTSAVLRNVASGVVAVDSDGIVTLANPSAAALVGEELAPGRSLAELPIGELRPRVEEFLASQDEEESVDLALGELQLSVRLTRLGTGGAVITMDDVSALARAQRVLAWGEMARQVAHEIKNPLTPIRLGVQHLRRAYATRRSDYEGILDQNVTRILQEIDRLDEIARAFSRYGTPPAERAPAEPVDVSAVVRDVIALENLGAMPGESPGAQGDPEARPIEWRVIGAAVERLALARRDELHEVLLNVLENARLAGASTVRVEIESVDVGGEIVLTIADDGDGIPEDVLPRIFEPHFSTRTSGSGLGLAISRRLLEGWGGSIAVESERGRGTTVRIALLEANGTNG